MVEPPTFSPAVSISLVAELNPVNDSGLSVNGQLHEAARVFEALRKEGLNADVVTYNTLICGLCKHSKVAEAESYLHKMVNRGFDPDAFTYNTIIGAYCKSGW